MVLTVPWQILGRKESHLVEQLYWRGGMGRLDNEGMRMRLLLLYLAMRPNSLLRNKLVILGLREAGANPQGLPRVE